MKPNIPYIVTKASDDGTFEVGDHIKLETNGEIGISCLEAAFGWIPEHETVDITKGMEVKVDVQRLEILKKRLLKELRELEEMMNENNSNASP